MSQLSLHFLGAFQVSLDGQPVTTFRSDKVRALLAYLVLEADRPHAREALAGFFWPGMSDSIARKNLRLTLHRLRQSLDDMAEASTLLHITQETVQWRDTAVYLDVTQFSQLLDAVESQPDAGCAANVERLATAETLYRGDFLQGFYLDDNLAFSEWVLLKRERLHRRMLWALHHLAAYHQRHGAYSQALPYAWRQLELEPWREEAHRQVMEILARRGERSAALAQYDACCRTLAQELSAEPTAETTALYQRIRAAQGSRHNLPGQPTPFVGRTAELAELVRLLADPDCRLLTIVGPGGMGKTRLALEAAAARLDAFLEGIYWVPLAAVDSINILPSAIVEALRAAYPGSPNPQMQLLDVLREKELLLVLDNFEHLLAGAPLLVEILQACPGVKLLVTSRERLNLRWEHCFQLGGLQIPQHTPADETTLAAYSALELFVEAAQRAQKHFTLTARDRAAAVGICQLVEGMPLGIELAAVWVGAYTCEQIAQEVARNLAFLETSHHDVPARHRSLQATFAHSWQLLAPDAQQAFMQLSVFQRGFTHEAAEKIVGAARFVLKSLVDKSLLRLVPPGRYEIHALLRQYAAEWLNQMPERETAVRDAHSDYYLAFLSQSAAALWGRAALQAQTAIQGEIENVRAAWEWSVQQARLAALQTGLAGLAHYFALVGPFQEGEWLMATAVNRIRPLAQAEPSTRQLLCQLLIELARFQNRQSRCEQALETVQAAIELAEAGQDDGLVAAAYVQLGQALLSLGQYDKAAQHLEHALARATAAGDQRAEVESLRRLAIVCFDQGNYADAVPFNDRALALYRAADDQRGAASILRSLGLIAWFLGHHLPARDYFEQALMIFAEIGDRHGTALQRHNLGRVALEQGDYPHAREQFAQASAIFCEIGDRQNDSWALLNLGRVSMYQGDYERSKLFCRQALRLFREIGARQGEALAQINLGGVFCQVGAYGEAAVSLQEALHICQEMGDRQSESWARLYLADLAIALGDYAAARLELEKTVKLSRQMGDRAGEGWGLCNLSLILPLSGDLPGAQGLAEQAQEIGVALHHLPLQAATNLHLGHIFVALGAFTAAAEVYETAVTHHRQLGQQHLAVEGVAGQARAALGLGQLTRALALVVGVLAQTGLDWEHGLPGTEEPLRIYFTCYQVLAANGDPRAGELLGKAHRFLRQRAAQIVDLPQRNRYLNEVAAHRAIQTEWVQLCAPV